MNLQNKQHFIVNGGGKDDRNVSGKINLNNEDKRILHSF